MKIVHISPVFLPYRSGMSNVVYEQTKHLSELRHEVVALAPIYKRLRLHDLQFKPTEMMDGVRIIRVKPIWDWGNGALVPDLVRKIRELQAEGKIDLIHLHAPFFGGLEIIWLLKKINNLFGIKLVIQYHHDAQFGLFKRILTWPSKLLLRSLARSADKVIVSSMDYARHSNLGDLINEKFVEIPLGVDLERFRPKDQTVSSDGDGQGKILFVGALDRQHHFKGVDVLLQAVGRLARAQADRPGPKRKFAIQVLIVGSGELVEYYDHLAHELRLDQQVSFLGFVEDARLPEIYRSADIFVFPSTGKAEAFGMVVLEAMSSGLPVIASDLPGVRTLFASQKLLFEAGSAQALSGLLEELLGNAAERGRIGQVNRQWTVEKYAWPLVVSKLEFLYQTLCLSGKKE